MRSPLHVVAAAALVLATVAGCASGPGSEAGKPAEQILNDAHAAAAAAASVHVGGTVLRGATTATIDLLLTSSGDGRERITTAGRTVELIKIGQVLYVKGLSAAGSGGYQQLSTRDPRAAQLAAQVDKNALFDQLIKIGDTPKITGSAPVGDRPAVQLTPSAGIGVLSVADDADNPYPLEVETAPATPGSSLRGALRFTDWNAHAVITPPAGSGN